MLLKKKLRVSLSVALLATSCLISRNATAQASLTVGAELEAGETAPFSGTLLREPTLQGIYADLLKKDDFKKALENCQVETTHLAEKSESNEVAWFFGGTALGAVVVELVKALIAK